MKKVLLLAAAVASAMSMNAALYLTGNCEASNWNPGAPLPFEEADGVYTLKVQGSMFKISTTTGEGAEEGSEWAAFNEGCYVLNELESLSEDLVGTEVGLIKGDANVTMPWECEWTLTVTIAADGESGTLVAEGTKPAGFPAVYLRGGMNGWGTEEAWQMSTEDGVIYVLDNVTIEEGIDFKVADAAWGTINYGAVEGDPDVYLDNETALVFNSGTNLMMAENAEDATATFNLDEKTLTIGAPAGVSAVVAENAAPVYYNLQGVRVNNPANGLYIVKQGSKISKIVR